MHQSCPVISGRWQIVDVRHRSIRLVIDPASILKRESLYSVPVLSVGDSLRELKQGQLSLRSDDCINKVRLQRLLRNKARMPTSENDRQAKAGAFSLSSQFGPPPQSLDPSERKCRGIGRPELLGESHFRNRATSGCPPISLRTQLAEAEKLRRACKVARLVADHRMVGKTGRPFFRVP